MAAGIRGRQGERFKMSADAWVTPYSRVAIRSGSVCGVVVDIVLPSPAYDKLGCCLLRRRVDGAFLRHTQDEIRSRAVWQTSGCTYPLRQKQQRSNPEPLRNIMRW